MKALDSGEEEEEEAVHTEPAFGYVKRVYLSLSFMAGRGHHDGQVLLQDGLSQLLMLSYSRLPCVICARKAAEKSEKKRSSAQAPVPAMLGKMFGLCIRSVFLPPTSEQHQ